MITTFEIEPLVGVGPIRLGASRAESRRTVGTLMLQSMRNSAYGLCLVLLMIALLTACASSKNSATDSSSSQSRITISFQKSIDFKAPLPPYSSAFEITDYHSSPGGVSNETGYLYTDQKFCLKGTAVPKPGQAETGSPSTPRRDTATFCFSINDYVPYKLYPDPIHPGIFPIGRWPPGMLYNPTPNEVTFVRLELREYYGNAEIPRARSVGLFNNDASGTIEITTSEKNRLAGKIDINDGNLTVTGSFDCPLR